MWIYLAINCAALILSWFYLPRGKAVALTFLFLELGLLFYFYMPIVSDLRNPPMNWAYPRTWEGFLHAICRKQYADVVRTPIISKTFLVQIGTYASDLRAQFTLPIVLLGFLPFTIWRLGKGRGSLYALVPSLALAAAAACLVAIAWLAGGEIDSSILRMSSGTEIHKLFIGGIVALVGIGLAGLVLLESRELANKLIDEHGVAVSEKVLVGMAFLALFAWLLYFEWCLTGILRDAEEATRMQKTLIVCLMALPLFVLGSVSWLLYGGLEMRFDMDRISRKWMLVVFLTFVVESVVMISFASPGGEIQELFIQRVKFVGSHGVFAIFIGYGLIVGLAFVCRLIAWNPLVTVCGIVCMVAVPLYPIVQNAPFHVNRLNKDYLLISGGASQRGHDFGWQFGNYQLRGMEAILAEMTGEEKESDPPPNPHWPPPMGPRAVFFGGTDPGRFVPTYMIFSGKVRSDVFLITQNALADKTYMSVMRDLYGNEIWIPSIEDHRRSFELFSKRYGGGKTRGDRMIVTGVQKVMQINGILCKMIHDNNKWKHDFYVEESYPIDWMYEYMEPHGLILKINKDKVPKLSQEVIKNDLEFWAWYSERLVNNPYFKNDACARKTFAKLRGAIAGMYERRAVPGPGRPPDQQLLKCAEQAYLEGIKLCPISHEAIFRLAGFYQKLNRIDDAIAILEDYKQVDAKSAKVSNFIARLKGRKQSWHRMNELKARAGAGLQLREIFELMGLCRAFGDQSAFIGMIETVLKQRKYSSDVYLRVAKMCSDVRDYGRMNRALQLFRETAPSNIPPDMYRAATGLYAGSGNLVAACEMLRVFLAVRPTDFRAWQELAAMNMGMKKETDALAALRRAVKVGAEASRDAIRADKRFRPLQSNEEFRKLIRSTGLLGRL
jgi:tetratricopeptide (TPR) repeat protein